MSSHAPVLVLDVDFQPLRIDHWQRVICDSFLGKLEVVEYSRDHTIKGVTRDYPMPAVVRVLRRFRRDKLAIKFSRLNIYARDAFTCQYCGEQLPSEDLTFDHVTPRSKGGRTTWENIVTCCVPCNSNKASRTPGEAAMALRRRPGKPRWLPAVTVAMDRRKVPEEWAAYWSGALQR
jgi:5-methylcytosine-specific restriction endonuclease McrA